MKHWYRRSLLVGICIFLLAACSPASSIVRDYLDYRITGPSGKWIIVFPAYGFKVETADRSRPYYFLMNDKTGLSVSFNFEQAPECNNSESCRDYFVNKLKTLFPNKKNWRKSQIGMVFVSENMDGPIGVADYKFQHMNAHYVFEGIWVDVHLSKSGYQETDRKLFIDFVTSIRFKPRTEF